MKKLQSNTTPEEVEKEIRLALQLAGIELEPEQFIELAADLISASGPLLSFWG
jgi:hypothetical protein